MIDARRKRRENDLSIRNLIETRRTFPSYLAPSFEIVRESSSRGEVATRWQLPWSGRLKEIIGRR